MSFAGAWRFRVWRGFLKAKPGKIARKHVCERDMSEAAINRRFERLAGLYDLACAFKHRKVKRVCKPSARYTVRPKRLKPKT